MSRLKAILRGASPLAVLLFIIAVSSCSSTKGKTGALPTVKVKKSPPPEVLYNEGMLLYSKGKYSKALEKFEMLKKRYPLNRFTILADLKVGDIHFSRKEYIEAIASYEEFVKLFPKDNMTPYALFRLGECYRVQVKSPERDLTYLKKASEYYNRVIEEFPESSYAKSARARLHDVKEFMARHIFLVGMFYYRLKKFRAAEGRFRDIVTNYRDTSQYYKALYYLGQTYTYLGYRDLAEKCFLTLLEGFQGGEYSLKAMKILETDYGYKREAFRPVERMEVKGEEFFKEIKETEVGGQKKTEKPTPEKPAEEKKAETKKEGPLPPITIEAKKVVSLRKEGKVIFTGDVTAKMKDMFLYANEVDAFLGEGGKGIAKLVAKGNVRVIQGERFGRCKEAEYFTDSGIIIMKGNPQVWYGENTVSGDVITINLAENRATVESREKVKAVIYPKEIITK